MTRFGRPSPWPQQEKALWKRADEILRIRGTETDPDEWIADAALSTAIAAAKLRHDLVSEDHERDLMAAYHDVLKWMSAREYNTNEYFRRDLARRMGLLGRRKLA